MGVITDRFDIVVDMRVHMREALFRVRTALNDVKQVRDDATCCEGLAMLVEIEAPRIR